MSCKLIIDERERHVTRHAVEFGDIQHEVKTITTGDYAVLTPAGKILAIFERKTYEDLGASLKDGRYSNKDKMVAMQRATGCKLYLVLEGKAFPAPSDTFARIPYHALESAVFHMEMRDGFSRINTEDSLGTARMLARFVKSASNLCARDPMDSILESRVDLAAVAAVAVSSSTSTTSTTGGSADSTAGSATAAVIPGAMDLLSARIEKTPRDIARNMWSKFRGISVESADEFLARWSIADLVAGKVDAALGEMKTSAGRKLGKNVVAAILGRDRAMEAKILAEIPGISLDTARKLLAGKSLHKLICDGAAELAAVVVTKNGAKFGQSRAEKTLECLRYSHLSAAEKMNLRRRQYSEHE